MSVVPISVSFFHEYPGPASLVAGLALRRCRPPLPTLVEYQGDLPGSLTYAGSWYKVRLMSEPDKLSPLWWEQSSRRSNFIAFIQPHDSRNKGGSESTTTIESENRARGSQSRGHLVLLVYDNEAGTWFIEGFYD